MTCTGSDLGGLRAEVLQQRPHAGDHDARAALGRAQPPQHLQPAAHRLHAGADPLERQRLPRGEQHHLAVGHVLHQVVVQLAGVGAGGAGDDQRPAVAQLGERGDG